MHEGTQLEFPFPNSGDPPGTATDSKKNLSFLLNLFKSESVERTHLYSYVFHSKLMKYGGTKFFFLLNIKLIIENRVEFPLFFGHVPIYNTCNKTI